MLLRAVALGSCFSYFRHTEKAQLRESTTTTNFIVILQGETISRLRQCKWKRPKTHDFNFEIACLSRMFFTVMWTLENVQYQNWKPHHEGFAEMTRKLLSAAMFVTKLPICWAVLSTRFYEFKRYINNIRVSKEGTTFRMYRRIFELAAVSWVRKSFTSDWYL